MHHYIKDLTRIVINDCHTSHSSGIEESIPIASSGIESQVNLKVFSSRRFWNAIIDDGDFKCRIIASRSWYISWINLISLPSDSETIAICPTWQSHVVHTNCINTQISYFQMLFAAAFEYVSILHTKPILAKLHRNHAR